MFCLTSQLVSEAKVSAVPSLFIVLVERNETKADPDYNNNYVIYVRLKKNFVAFACVL